MSGSLVLFKIPKNKINQDPEILSLTTQEDKKQKKKQDIHVVEGVLSIDIPKVYNRETLTDI